MTKEINETRPPEFTKQFDKQLDRLPNEIKIAFRDTLALFLEDQFNSVLNNHPLIEKLAGYRSINLNGDYIALFKEKFTAKHKIVTFHKIGTHKKLYRNTKKK